MAHSLTSLTPPNHTSGKAIIGVVHLGALPGSVGYDQNFSSLLSRAVKEAMLYSNYKLDGIIVENFADAPFFPEAVPAVTVSAMAIAVNAICDSVNIRVGVNVLRNDARSALSIAATTNADFIRVNVHTGAAVTDQGLINGKAHETLRLRETLGKKISILADIDVKHAAQVVRRPIGELAKESGERGAADGLIVTGSGTGRGVNLEDLKAAKASTLLPVFVGSGVKIESLDSILQHADGIIVGSAFKIDGDARNPIEESRLENFMSELNAIRG